ncbi:MAG TPA: hypothetical protein VK760_14280, partial [Candidatus Acidoferrales bacterium]|nr:hypothetical protein [Candidatus Acidoferrales bacterium]
MNEAARLFDERVREFQRGLRLTACVAIPATILIAMVLGQWTTRELVSVIGVAVVFAVIALPIAHYLDRRQLGAIRDRMTDRSLPTETAIAKLKWFRVQVVVNFIVAYVVGLAIVLVAGNRIAGVPLETNVIPIVVAGLCGGALVDGALNYFNAEALVAELIAILCTVRGVFAPVSAKSRGGIGRRFLVVLAIVIAVTMLAMAGGTFHLLLELQAGTIKLDDVLRTGAIYTASALVVALLIALLATRILARSVARPILHTVGLMDRLRHGEVFREEELYGEPRFSHEAGLLVEAFADANIGLSALAT